MRRVLTHERPIVHGVTIELLNLKRWCQAGAQPALHFGGVCNFHEISFDDVIVLIRPFNRGTTFSQTVGDNVFLAADTKSIVQTHIFCTTLGNKNKTERFATALEAESPVSSEISDLRNF